MSTKTCLAMVLVCVITISAKAGLDDSYAWFVEKYGKPFSTSQTAVGFQATWSTNNFAIVSTFSNHVSVMMAYAKIDDLTGLRLPFNGSEKRQILEANAHGKIWKEIEQKNDFAKSFGDRLDAMKVAMRYTLWIRSDGAWASYDHVQNHFLIFAWSMYSSFEALPNPF